MCGHAGNRAAGGVGGDQTFKQVAVYIGFPCAIDVMRIETFGLAAIAAIDISALRWRGRTGDSHACEKKHTGMAFERFQDARNQTSTSWRFSLI